MSGNTITHVGSGYALGILSTSLQVTVSGNYMTSATGAKAAQIDATSTAISMGNTIKGTDYDTNPASIIIGGNAAPLKGDRFV